MINVKISGQFLTKNTKNAGSVGSGNSIVMRIEFDNSWAGFAKRIIWHDAKGENETAVLLVPDIAQNTNVYNTFVPVEATTCAGWCSFTVEGYYDSNPSKALKTVSDRLYVAFADSSALGEPTASEVMQLHTEFENLMPKVSELLAGTTQEVERLEKNITRWEEYKNDSLYHPGNKVVYNGSCYVCLQEAYAVKPENKSHWLLIAHKGEQGLRGEQGPQGIRGETGARGEKGERGMRGETGARGEKGERGIAGSVVPTNGFYSFDVDEQGDLWVNYPDESEMPTIELNENGELILTVGGVGTASFNVGKVKGDAFVYEDFTEENKEDLLKDAATKRELENHNNAAEAHPDIRKSLETCFTFEEGYEDEIDSYGSAYEQKWYKIKPPKDSLFIGSWCNYYIYAYGNERGELFQMKILDGNKGIYFRTGRSDFDFDLMEYVNSWNEWSKTILSNEVENKPIENSTNLITSGGVYEAIGDIETSLENIITKYGLGGETA